MKIGILTLPFNNNYGGYLQSCALYLFLENMGHEVILINRRGNTPSFFKNIILNIKRFIKFILKKEKFYIGYNEFVYDYKGTQMHIFVDKIIHNRTKRIYNSNDLEKIGADFFDAVIVGSDQVWRPDYVPAIEDFFFRFIKNDKVRKISYAASFGSSMPLYSRQQQKKCGSLISKFHGVSIRESSGKDVIEYLQWKCPCPKVVLDPTFLFDSTFYDQYLNNFLCKYRSNGFIFSYILDSSENNKMIVDSISAQLGLEIYSIIDNEKWKSNDYIMPSIEDWLIGIRESAFVVTDSFHGTVFSIIYNKPFWVILNEDRGKERFVDLLAPLGLEDRIIHPTLNFSKSINKIINWPIVNQRIEELRLDSITWITEQLN